MKSISIIDYVNALNGLPSFLLGNVSGITIKSVNALNGLPAFLLPWSVPEGWKRK